MNVVTTLHTIIILPKSVLTTKLQYFKFSTFLNILKLSQYSHKIPSIPDIPEFTTLKNSRVVPV